jgi:hypothetical protein
MTVALIAALTVELTAELNAELTVELTAELTAVPRAGCGAFLQSGSRIPVQPPAVWLILLEALLALALFVFIVWWTMFHGRKKPPKE